MLPPPSLWRWRHCRCRTLPARSTGVGFRNRRPASSLLPTRWRTPEYSPPMRRDDDFFDVGGHSLAAAQLLSSVDGAVGVRLSMRALLENPTVEGMCDEIEARQRRDGDEREAGRVRPDLDLRAEAVLEPEIAPERADLGVATLQDARRVFLTGATGFLGAFLLDALLLRTNAEVHCLVRPRKGERHDPMEPIRANLQRYGLWEPGQARRVILVAGD